MTESKLKTINVTVAQLQKLVNIASTNLSDDRTVSDQDLKTLFRLSVYLRVLADFLYNDDSGVANPYLYIPYNLKGLFETDWMDHDADMTASPLLIKMNHVGKTLKNWYIKNYSDKQTFFVKGGSVKFDALMHDAHDWVIARLRKADLVLDSAFNDDGVSLIQENGCSFFGQIGTVTLVPNKLKEELQ